MASPAYQIWLNPPIRSKFVSEDTQADRRSEWLVILQAFFHFKERLKWNQAASW
jgi:hypothetical protein